MLMLDFAANGATLDLGRGEVAELRLEEMSGTGFTWRLAADGSPACRMEAMPRQPGAVAAPGARFTRAWRIEGIQPGLCRIVLEELRPWETVPPRERYQVTLQIRG